MKHINLIASIVTFIVGLIVFYNAYDKMGYSIAILNFYSSIINYIQAQKEN